MTAPRARPPAPLPRRARALLAAHREANDIPDDVAERIWSVVGADDAPEPAFDPLEAPTASSRAHRRWLVYGGAALAAAAVLLLAWRLGGTLAERRHAARTPAAAVMHGEGTPSQGRASATPGTATVATPKQADPAPPPSAVPESSPEPTAPEPSPTPAETTARSRASSPSTAPRPAAPTTEPEPTAPASTFAAERELVARAWRALALGDHTDALQAATEHARRFPAGLLAPERTAIETIARCRQDPTDGPRRAAAFHRAHPRSPLAARVDEACDANEITTAP